MSHIKNYRDWNKLNESLEQPSPYGPWKGPVLTRRPPDGMRYFESDIDQNIELSKYIESDRSNLTKLDWDEMFKEEGYEPGVSEYDKDYEEWAEQADTAWDQLISITKTDELKILNDDMIYWTDPIYNTFNSKRVLDIPDLKLYHGVIIWHFSMLQLTKEKSILWIEQHTTSGTHAGDHVIILKKDAEELSNRLTSVARFLKDNDFDQEMDVIFGEE